jgi:hypothetical protein
MKKRTTILAGSVLAALVALAGLVWLVGFAHAGPLALLRPQANAPALVTYQGYLTDAAGDPVADGNYDLKFELCATSGCTTVLWGEKHMGQPVQDGYFTVLLGSVTALSASDFDGSERWLQVSAKASSESIYKDFDAQQVTAVPYAFSLLPGAYISGTANFMEGILNVRDNGSEAGVIATSWGGTGVYGGNLTYGQGVLGWSTRGVGVSGQSSSGYGGEFSSGVGHALVVDGPSLDYGRNPEQIGMLRWYEAVSMTTPIAFDVGDDPEGLAFDGDHIWVANFMDDTVTKLRASDGLSMATYSVGDAPQGICFDGGYIWTANKGDDTVTKLRANDGTVVGTYNVDSEPMAITFDGSHIWVTSEASGTVTKLRASDGGLVGTYSVGGDYTDIAFDGADIWVTSSAENWVTKVRASDGTRLITVTVNNPSGVAFDGANVWVTSRDDGTVTKIQADDGTVLYTTFSIFGTPVGLVFDGAHIWVADWAYDTLTKLRASDGVVVATVPASIGDFGGMAFDGTHVWVENWSPDTVSKH